MSDARSYLKILEIQKELIISQWYKGIVQQYPGFYNHEKLMQETNSYFQFLLELETPLENHPLHSEIPRVCEHLLKRDVPVAHIIHSNQLWVDAMLFFVQEDPLGKTIPMHLIRKIINRVFEYERKILNQYNAILREQLQTNERTITGLHESRLAIVGKMAASMAHEIRNPLTTILGFLKILRNYISNHSSNTSENLSTYLDIIESEFTNIQMQITGFLSFSKKEIIEEPLVGISANTLIKSVIAMITPRMINENISFQFIEGKDMKLKVQKIAVQQVLSNIISNSIDALSEIKGDKKLTITCEITGDAYVICVTNNGPVIPEEIKDSLFEPFVTGKEEGTGLGLAICKQIMTKNSGDVTFVSSENETAFHIKFLEPSLLPT